MGKVLLAIDYQRLIKDEKTQLEAMKEGEHRIERELTSETRRI